MDTLAGQYSMPETARPEDLHISRGLQSVNVWASTSAKEKSPNAAPTREDLMTTG